MRNQRREKTNSRREREWTHMMKVGEVHISLVNILSAQTLVFILLMENPSAL